VPQNLKRAGTLNNLNGWLEIGAGCCFFKTFIPTAGLK
jgi:hypothetical protein